MATQIPDAIPSSGTPPYVELHCHSAYSFLDGVSLPDELAHSAAELGHTALALTDHNSVSGSMELAQVAGDAGVRAIHGAEIDVTVAEEPEAPGGGAACDHRSDRARAGTPFRSPNQIRHLTLLVRDARGWRNLCRILTHAHAGTREAHGRERTEPSVALQTVLDHTEGLVCLTGCAEHGVHERPTARRLLRRVRAAVACGWSYSVPTPVTTAPATGRSRRSLASWG